MRDEARLVLNSLLTYGSRAVAAIVGIFMVPYLIRELGYEAYGVIGITQSILALVVVADMGLGPATARQLTRFLHLGENRRASELASTALFLFLGIGTIAIAISLLVGDRFLEEMQLSGALRSEAQYVLIIIAASFCITLVQVPYEAALAYRMRYDISQYCQAAGAVVRAGFIVLLFSIEHASLLIWASATLLWSAASLLIHRWQAQLQVPSLGVGRRLVSRRGLRDLGQFGSFTAVTRVAQWLSQQSGPMIISAFLGPGSVTLYAPAILVVVSLQPLHRAFLSQLTPVITRSHAEGDLDNIGYVLERSVRYSLLTGGAALLFVATLAFPLVRVWLGPEFSITSMVLVLGCISAVLQAGSGAEFAVLMGTGRVRLLALLNVVPAAAGAGAAIYLIAQTELGVLAPAIALLAGQVLRSAGGFWAVTRITGLHRVQYLRRGFAGPLLCLTCLALASFGVQWLLAGHDLLELASATVFSGIVFAGLAWRVGLNADDRERARGYLSALRLRKGTDPSL